MDENGRRNVVLRDIAKGYGACFASKQITDGGLRVGYMYREFPDHLQDSGWRFFSGRETQEFVDDPTNTGIYDVNTIANFDPEILPLLDSPPGTAFGRDPETGRFLQEEQEAPEDEEIETEAEAAERKRELVGKEFPVVSGEVQLTEAWSLSLPHPLSRRVEDGSLVLWRRDFTIWLTVWHGQKTTDLHALADRVLQGRDPLAFDLRREDLGDLLRDSFRIEESRDGQVVHGFYGLVFVSGGHLQLAVYFDRPEDIAEARQIVSSVRFRPVDGGTRGGWLFGPN